MVGRRGGRWSTTERLNGGRAGGESITTQATYKNLRRDFRIPSKNSNPEGSPASITFCVPRSGRSAGMVAK